VIATFSQATGQAKETIAQDTRGNHWLGAQQAQAYGLVGRIVQRAREV
jgi:ATP-dependent Clp protease protease subunit